MSAPSDPRLPDFLIIGASKSGTTTLFEYLDRHPGVFMCRPKEPDFFCRDEQYARGLAWYASLFADAEPGQLCGEASTHYTNSPRFPDAASRIAQHLPGAKLIFIMREPVGRAYSLYVQGIKTAQNVDGITTPPHTFEDHLANDFGFTDAIDYLAQIKLYREHFPRESFLFLLFEDLVQDPGRTLDQITDLLGVDRFPEDVRALDLKSNVATEHFDRVTRSQIAAKVKRIPFAQAISNALPQSVREFTYRLLRRSGGGQKVAEQMKPPPMLPETRAKLDSQFRGRNRELSEYLGIDLSAWE